MNAKRTYLLIGLCLSALLIIFFVIVWQLRQFETRLFALNAQTGSVEWSAALPEPTDTVPQIAIGNQRVLIDMMRADDSQNPPGRQLIAFDAASGQQQWAFEPDKATFGDIPLDPSNRPVILADKVYFRLYDKNGILAVLNTADGTLRWTQTSTPNNYGLYPTIQQTKDHLVMLFYENEGYVLSLLDPQSCARIEDIWRSGADEKFYPDYEPYLLVNDQLIILSTNKSIYTFDAETGAQRYQLDGHSRRIWLVGATLYTGDSNLIQAHDALTGEKRWVYQLDANAAQPRSSLTTLRANTETVYILSSYVSDSEANEEVRLFTLNAQDGSERWVKSLNNEGGPHSWYISFWQAASSTPEMVFVARNLKEIVALSAADGTERWYFRASVGASPQPATDGERVFVIREDTRWRNWLAQFNLARR